MIGVEHVVNQTRKTRFAIVQHCRCGFPIVVSRFGDTGSESSREHIQRQLFNVFAAHGKYMTLIKQTWLDD